MFQKKLNLAVHGVVKVQGSKNSGKVRFTRAVFWDLRPKFGLLPRKRWDKKPALSHTELQLPEKLENLQPVL
jgi:hypothetical protein